MIDMTFHARMRFEKEDAAPIAHSIHTRIIEPHISPAFTKGLQKPGVHLKVVVYLI